MNGVYIYKQTIVQFFDIPPKIVCWLPVNRHEIFLAVVFSSITLSTQGIENANQHWAIRSRFDINVCQDPWYRDQWTK